jgi:hypothetical protein
VVLEKDGEDRVRNKEVLHGVQEEENIIHTIRRWKAI